MNGLFNYLARNQAQQQQPGLLGFLSNQGRLIQPQQQPMPMQNDAAGALQSSQQAMMAAQQQKKQQGGGMQAAMSILKLFMGG